MTRRVATDVGGTFTDLVSLVEGRVTAVKTDTTPPHFEQGVLNALARSTIPGADISFFVHGSTVVINALTERKGVKTGLITTAGFRDVLEIARGNTPDLFNIYYRKPKPLVPRYLRREVRERMSYKGEILTPLAAEDLPAILADFKADGVEAIAVCLLHAYANPTHERQVVHLIKQQWPQVPVIASHEISLEWREYERTNTTVMSAYVLPVARGYLERLEHGLKTQAVRPSPFIMQSNGGIATVMAAKANPITLVESGPVSGILGAVVLGDIIGERNLIVLDIGGTTAKCSLVQNGETRITTEYYLERTPTSPGYPLKTPVIDIVEIGNGGGSIAWVDSAGSLHVGPQSAGSQPGPVAYGRGGIAPTTTDANLITGRINPERFVGGTISPDMTAVRDAFARLGGQLGYTAEATAHGVLQIANANMVNALKLVSVNRGYDPRDFALMAIGGGGPMHATALAAELGIPKVIVPPHAAVFSAWGMLMLDLRRDYIRTRIVQMSVESLDILHDTFRVLSDDAEEAFRADGFDPSRLRLEWFIDARYRGQEHTVKVPVAQNGNGVDIAGTVDRFHAKHQQEFTFRLNNPVEAVNFHLIAYGLIDKSRLDPAAIGPADPGAALLGVRDVSLTDQRRVTAQVYERALLRPGMQLQGPALIEEESTVTVVLPGHRVSVDAWGSLHIDLSTGS